MDKEAPLPKETPRITVKVLRNLIINLPPERLAELPVASLPDNIPMSLVDQTHAGKRAILEDKLLEHQAFILSIREVIRRELGTRGMNAYDLAQQEFSTSHLEKFSSKFLEYKAYKSYFDFQAQDDGPQCLLALLEKEQQEAEDMHHDYLELIRAEKSLRNAALPSGVQERVDLARNQLLKLISVHKSHLGQFFAERLALAVAEMRQVSQQIQENQPNRDQVTLKIEMLEATADSENKLLGDRIYRPGREKSVAIEAKELKDQLFSLELSYGETELKRWLDYMVDYFMHFNKEINADPLFAKARKYIQRLMSLSFQMSETHTAAISTDTASHTRAEELHQYQQRSRDYMESYFDRRAGDLYQQSHSTLFSH